MATVAHLEFPNGKSADVNTGLFINNKWVKSSNGETIEVVNPATGKNICDVQAASEEDIDLAVDAAEEAFRHGSWSELTPADRGKLLTKLADLMKRDAEIIASIETFDNGKAIQLARFDANAAHECIRYYGGWADKIHGKVIETGPNTFNYTRAEPIGVCGQIIPWNFPILMWAWKIGPAIASGNTVVMKTAENTPLSAAYCCNLIKEAGFPPGVINNVTGYGKIAGHAIASHMKIKKVAFTGSTLVGRAVLKASAASNLKKCTLELGGKSPNIIFDDADIEKAVEWLNFGIFFNAGQTCCAGSRVYIQEAIYDKVIETFKKRALQNKIGDPFDENTFQGAQVSKVQHDRILNYINIGKKEGARLVTGGEVHGANGYFIKPTVFADVREDMQIMKEEIFGPVVSCAKFKDMDDVVRMSNDSVYGLAAAVHTKDIQIAINTANKLNAGTVWVNQYNNLHHALPFGGYNESGIGRELGKEALKNYTQVKTVQIALE